MVSKGLKKRATYTRLRYVLPAFVISFGNEAHHIALLPKPPELRGIFLRPETAGGRLPCCRYMRPSPSHRRYLGKCCGHTLVGRPSGRLVSHPRRAVTFEGPFYLDARGRIIGWDEEKEAHAKKLVERELTRLRTSFEAAKADGYRKLYYFCITRQPTFRRMRAVLRPWRRSTARSR